MFALCLYAASALLMLSGSSMRARAASLHILRHNADDTPLERETRETFDVADFFQRYGYLQPASSTAGDRMFHSEYTIQNAISEFQKFTGLPETGTLDQATMTKMRAPRCGFPDKSNNRSTQLFSDWPQAQNFLTLGTRWGKDTVTWKPLKLSRQLPERDQWQALERAFKYWSDITPLKFQYSAGEADIDVAFERAEHGDGYNNRFDGRGGVLAHAFQPGRGIGGDTHFDDDEQWSLGTGQGTDFEIVAAHEFGHALGLGHSNVPSALMAPYYQYVPKLKLHEDDIRGIQTLYGAKYPVTTTTSTTPSTTTTSTTTTTTTPPTTTATSTTTTTTKPLPTSTTTTTERPWVPSYCRSDFRVDATTGDAYGNTYIFRDDRVYKVGPWGLEAGFPRYIDDVFKGGPKRHLLAAVYLPDTRQHYLFKGTKVWRFTDFQLDQGYPRVWLSYSDYQRFRPSAALTFTYGPDVKVFMFGDGQFWEWDRRYETVSPGYPLQTDVYWMGAPRHPDAATTDTSGNFYFFKGSRYYTLHNRVAVGESKPIADWFGFVCSDNYRHIIEAGDKTRDAGSGNEGFEENVNEFEMLGSYKSVGYPETAVRRNAPFLPFEIDLGRVA